MVEASELLRPPIFADLPDDQIAWFIGQSQELALKPDEAYVHQGDRGDEMFVVRDGQHSGQLKTGRHAVPGISALGGRPDCEAMNHSESNAKPFNECCPDEAR